MAAFTNHWSFLCRTFENNLPLQNIDQLSLLNSDISPGVSLT